MGWLVAAPLFFILFLMSRHEHTQISIYQNTREYFKHIFEQSSQQSNRQPPYQSRVLAVTSRCVYRPSVVQLLVWVFVCVCLVAFYLSLHCSRVSLRAHPLPFHIGDHGAISLTCFIFDYQIVFLYTALSLSPLVFHLRNSRSVKKLGPQY